MSGSSRETIHGSKLSIRKTAKIYGTHYRVKLTTVLSGIYLNLLFDCYIIFMSKAGKDNKDPSRGKGQSERLETQHKISGGPAGTFHEAARQHDLSIRKVMELILQELVNLHPDLNFRHRIEVPKQEINEKLASVDPKLGDVLFVQKASIRPDGGIIEVEDNRGNFRVVLVSESKHQGNDVEKILAGIKQGKGKDADLMVAGNAIERAHKNIQEFRNLMLDEIHFPYVVFLQGSNFATNTFFVDAPDGRKVKIAHDAGNLNRIDRVTASSFSMEINRNYCRNLFVQLDDNVQMLQAASLYFQSDKWSSSSMAKILLEIASTSLNVLSESLPTKLKIH